MNIKFETGKLYKLKLLCSDSKHYFSSKDFNSIFTRKVVIKNKSIARLKVTLMKLKFFQKIKWWFVPVKTGIFSDLFCSKR